ARSSAPLAVSATKLWASEPTVHGQLRDAKSTGDALGKHGLNLARHQASRGFLPSRENLDLITSFLINAGLVEEMLKAGRFETLEDFETWVKMQPSTEQLSEIRSDSPTSSPETSKELPEEAQTTPAIAQ